MIATVFNIMYWQRFKYTDQWDNIKNSETVQKLVCPIDFFPTKFSSQMQDSLSTIQTVPEQLWNILRQQKTQPKLHTVNTKVTQYVSET